MSGGLRSPIAGLIVVPPLLAFGLRAPQAGVLHVVLALGGVGVLATLDVVAGVLPAADAIGRGATLAWTLVVVAVVVALQRRVLGRVGEVAEGRVSAAERLAAERDGARRDAESEIARHRAYVATISHELRTPLSGLLGMTSALEGTVLDRTQREILAAMRTSGRSLHAIVDDMLDYESLERGSIPVAPDAVSPDAVVGEVVDLFAPVAHERGVEVVAEVAPAVPDSLRLDRQRLTQILANLVGNAAKFTAKGEIVVAASYRRPGILAVEVRDTGSGIDEARRASLFEPFAGGDATLARRFGGSGLGMAISKRLAEHLGGSLELVSTGPTGSTFRLLIPAAQLAPAPAPSTGAVPAVLLVDASAAVRSAWAATCLRHGTVSTEVASLDEALATLSSRHRVVVLDTQTSGGSEAIEALRRRSDAWSRIPIVLAVRSPDLDAARAIRDAGLVSATTIKPLAFARVAAAVQQVMGAVRGASSRPPVTSRVLSVLVVDDDRINRLATRLVLRRSGHDVVEAGSGDEALKLAADRAFDLVLLDVHMPDMLGTDVARRLRAGNGASARALLVALTAAAFASDRDECLRAGMDVFLTKPFEPSVMHDVLERAERRAHGPHLEAP